MSRSTALVVLLPLILVSLSVSQLHKCNIIRDDYRVCVCAHRPGIHCTLNGISVSMDDLTVDERTCLNRVYQFEEKSTTYLCSRLCHTSKQVARYIATCAAQAVRDITPMLPHFTTFCCDVQRVLMDLYFSLEEEVFKNVLISIRSSSLDSTRLSTYLTRTHWCRAFQLKCLQVLTMIHKGCEHVQNRERRNLLDDLPSESITKSTSTTGINSLSGYVSGTSVGMATTSSRYFQAETSYSSVQRATGSLSLAATSTSYLQTASSLQQKSASPSVQSHGRSSVSVLISSSMSHIKKMEQMTPVSSRDSSSDFNAASTEPRPLLTSVYSKEMILTKVLDLSYSIYQAGVTPTETSVVNVGQTSENTEGVQKIPPTPTPQKISSSVRTNRVYTSSKVDKKLSVEETRVSSKDIETNIMITITPSPSVLSHESSLYRKTTSVGLLDTSTRRTFQHQELYTNVAKSSINQEDMKLRSQFTSTPDNTYIYPVRTQSKVKPSYFSSSSVVTNTLTVSSLTQRSASRAKQFDSHGTVVAESRLSNSSSYASVQSSSLLTSSPPPLFPRTSLSSLSSSTSSLPSLPRPSPLSSRSSTSSSFSRPQRESSSMSTSFLHGLLSSLSPLLLPSTLPIPSSTSLQPPVTSLPQSHLESRTAAMSPLAATPSTVLPRQSPVLSVSSQHLTLSSTSSFSPTKTLDSFQLSTRPSSLPSLAAPVFKSSLTAFVSSKPLATSKEAFTALSPSKSLSSSSYSSSISTSPFTSSPLLQSSLPLLLLSQSPSSSLQSNVSSSISLSTSSSPSLATSPLPGFSPLLQSSLPLLLLSQSPSSSLQLHVSSSSSLTSLNIHRPSSILPVLSPSNSSIPSVGLLSSMFKLEVSSNTTFLPATRQPSVLTLSTVSQSSLQTRLTPSIDSSFTSLEPPYVKASASPSSSSIFSSDVLVSTVSTSTVSTYLRQNESLSLFSSPSILSHLTTSSWPDKNVTSETSSTDASSTYYALLQTTTVSLSLTTQPSSNGSGGQLLPSVLSSTLSLSKVTLQTSVKKRQHNVSSMTSLLSSMTSLLSSMTSLLSSPSLSSLSNNSLLWQTRWTPHPGRTTETLISEPSLETSPSFSRNITKMESLELSSSPQISTKFSSFQPSASRWITVHPSPTSSLSSLSSSSSSSSRAPVVNASLLSSQIFSKLLETTELLPSFTMPSSLKSSLSSSQIISPESLLLSSLIYSSVESPSSLMPSLKTSSQTLQVLTSSRISTTSLSSLLESSTVSSSTLSSLLPLWSLFSNASSSLQEPLSSASLQEPLSSASLQELLSSSSSPLVPPVPSVASSSDTITKTSSFYRLETRSLILSSFLTTSHSISTEAETSTYSIVQSAISTMKSHPTLVKAVTPSSRTEAETSTYSMVQSAISTMKLQMTRVKSVTPSSRTEVETTYSTTVQSTISTMKPQMTIVKSVTPSETQDIKVSFSSVVLTGGGYKEMFLIIFDGTCPNIERQNEFKVAFLITVRGIIGIKSSLVDVLSIKCGSIQVLFSVTCKPSSKILDILESSVRQGKFSVKWDGKIFKALNITLWTISSTQPTMSLTSSRTNPTVPVLAKTENEKRAVKIIFILFVAIFVALSLFGVVICIAKACGRRRYGQLKLYSSTLSTRGTNQIYKNELELVRLSPLHHGADYYGGRQVQSRDPESDDENHVNNRTALLNMLRTDEVASRRGKIIIKDDNSYSSIAFY